jgi:ribosomal protein L40E
MAVMKCPHCAQDVTFNPEHAGLSATCPHCDRQFKLPFSTAGGMANRFCRNCGSSVPATAIGCMTCGLDPNDGDKFCPACGAETNSRAVVCVKCGVGLRKKTIGGDSEVVMPPAVPRNPVFMALLSGCCFAGLGQIVLGQTKKGLAILIGAILFAAVTHGIGIFPFWIVFAVDAYLIAKKLKHGQSVGQWEFF